MRINEGMNMDEWERLPSDTNCSFRAFRVYRDLGPGRSLEKARQALLGDDGKPRYRNTRTFQEWSSRHRWVERCAAYDRYIDNEQRMAAERKMIKDRNDMKNRHQTIAKAMEKVVLEKLIPDREDPNKTLDPGLLKVRDLPGFVKVATELARTSLDMPTAIVQVGASPDQAKYNDPRWIDEYIKLARQFGLIPDAGTDRPTGDSSPSQDQ